MDETTATIMQLTAYFDQMSAEYKNSETSEERRQELRTELMKLYKFLKLMREEYD